MIVESKKGFVLRCIFLFPLAPLAYLGLWITMGWEVYQDFIHKMIPIEYKRKD